MNIARRLRACLAVLVTVFAGTGCATRVPPATATAMTWRQPDVPRELAARVADTTRYQQAWSRIRGGDLGNGERELSDLLRAAPTFYPAAASLGELRLQRRDYGQAI